jgi:DNA-binding protein HU-beta
VTKADLIDEVANATGLTKKEVTNIVEAVFDQMTNALEKHEKVQIVGFGTFEPRRRKARIGRDPRTQEEIRIGPSWSLNFRPGKQLKDLLTGKGR